MERELMNRTWSPDWPTERLRPLIDRWGFRILRRERVRSGKAPWGGRSRRRYDPGQYDPRGTWTETEYTLRRDLTCERCGQAFGYNFEVSQISRQHAAGRSTDGSLRRELARQLRRRVRCPQCGAVQREPRRTLRRRDRRQAFGLLGLMVGALVALAVLVVLGTWLLGVLGTMLGSVLALALVIVALVWLLPELVCTSDTI
jgi:hypothetical protein